MTQLAAIGIPEFWSKKFMLKTKSSIQTWDHFDINSWFWTKYNFQNSLWHLASLFSAKADTTGYHPWDTGCYKNIPVMRQKCKLIRHTVYVDVNHVVDIIGKGH